MEAERPDPDELLSRVQRAEERERRGSLKVFLGACAGVGKTYAMLEAGQRFRRSGIDVVVGYAETHGRAETDALLAGLEAIPARHAEYRGTRLRELDLDAALARKPRILLVDELAHTNAPGSRHAKRWQDVRALLDAGIDVITTVNIQHVESQNDLVAQITHVTVRETVPDSVLEEADGLEIVDLPPEELLQRFREGKVYVAETAERAKESFFRKGNLIALRQLALRYVAEWVDRQMQDYRRDESVSLPWPVAERVIVCVGPSPHSLKVVRAARRLAARLRAELIAVYVETPGTTVLPADDRDRVLKTLHLAEQLGAETVTLTGTDLIDVVLRYARERNASKIVIGKPLRRTVPDVLFGSAVDRLVRQSGEIDVYIVKGIDEPRPAGELPSPPSRSADWRRPLFLGIAVVAACTVLAAVLYGRLQLANLIMIYLAGIVFVATRYGHIPSIAAAVLSVLAFDFFFVPPRYTFAISDTEYGVTFGVMLLVSLVISRLAVRVRQQAEAALGREHRTAALYSLSRELASTRGLTELCDVVRRHVEDLLKGEAAIYLPDEEGKLKPAGGDVREQEKGVIQWAYDHKQAAGAGTWTLPGSRSVAMPLQVANEVVGVLSYAPRDSEALLAPQPLRLLETLAALAAVALQRERLARQTVESQLRIESQNVRNTLLAGISHDLRTPLAAIVGATSLLLSKPDMESSVRLDLLRAVRDDANYMNRVVANVLDLTRLQTGNVCLEKEPQPLVEIVGAAAGVLHESLQGRAFDIRLPSDLPMVPMDAGLLQQVVVNLIENAVQHTPPGTPVELSARAEGGRVIVEVADRGPGLKPGDEQRVFDEFYRTTVEGRRAGMGLGLTLSKAIIQLHGGTITAENRAGGGALFRFTLPLDDERSTQAAIEPARPAEEPHVRG